MTEKQLIMIFVMTFLLSLAAIYFIHEIIVRIKNKTKKDQENKLHKKQQKLIYAEIY